MNHVSGDNNSADVGKKDIFTELHLIFIIQAFLVPSNDGQLACFLVHLLHMKTTQRNTSMLVSASGGSAGTPALLMIVSSGYPCRGNLQ